MIPISVSYIMFIIIYDFLFDYVDFKKTANKVDATRKKFFKDKLFFNCNEPKIRVFYSSQHIKI